MPCDLSPVPDHSAHIGQDVEIHYPWHPLYGRRVRLRNSEQRSAGRIDYVEESSGVVIIIAAWMLDPVTCINMTLGEPIVTVTALRALHQLLIEHGLRRNSPDNSDIVRVKRDEDFIKESSSKVAVDPATPDQHSVRGSRASRDKPSAAHENTGSSDQSADASRHRRYKGGR